MSFLIDIFGYLTVVLHGLSITAEALTAGGAAFALLVVAALRTSLSPQAQSIENTTYRILSLSALALAVVEIGIAAMQVAVLTSTEDVPVSTVLNADFAHAAMIKISAAILIAVLAYVRKAGARALIAALALIVEISSVSASHAIAQIDGRAILGLYDLLHRLGAAVWIGGLPYFLMALNRLETPESWRIVGKRYSTMSMFSVAAILCAGIGMALPYIGTLQGVYGTAYGVMVMTKVALFCGLLLFGLHNYRFIDRIGFDPVASIVRLKRSVEVEIGVGITVFFCAASITSLPPAIDLPNDRVTVHEIVERLTPHWPRLASPSHGDLAIPALQAKLDAEAAAAKQNAAAEAFVPGAGNLPPRNAEDIAWSEYNHHWAGILVTLIGIAALVEKCGFRPARHWPLLFLVLAAFLLIRSDPEVWPMGHEGLIASLRDPEVVQHRIFVLVIVLFGVFEWRVRAGNWGSSRAALVFPLITAVGAALLLTHSHAISNIKDQLLIELSHVPLALLGVSAGWARWLELRLPGRPGRRAGYIWPVCFILIGFVLIAYREA